MRRSEIFNKNRQIFLNRTPEGFFYLSELEKGRSFSGRKDFDLEGMKKRASLLSLEKIDLLYVYGTALGQPYLLFKKWLEEKTDRQLVFLEENPVRLGRFLTTNIANECLSHPRVHIFLTPKEVREDVLEEVAKKFPMNHLELMFVPPYDEERAAKIKLQLFRKTTLSEAFLYDALFSHRHFSNFFPNARKIASSSLVNRMQGRWKGIPAIICGAGPSLQDVLELLPDVKNRALVMAGGSAIAALSSHGVFPHIAMAFDPNFEEYLRMKSSFAWEIPFFFATRLFSRSFSTFNGPLGYMRSAIGGLEELWMDENLRIQKENLIGEKLSQEALSVTTIAIALARFLGCDPILLCGVDLSYRDQKRYAEGIVADNRAWIEEVEGKKIVSDRIFERRSLDGKQIHTSTKWLMETDAISSYAKEFPKTRFFNTSAKGLSIAGIPYASLPDLLQKELLQSMDITAFLHAEMERTRFARETDKKMDRFKKRLKKSFVRCEQLIAKILSELEGIEKEGIDGRDSFETSAMILADMDLKEEDAFLYFLSDLPAAIERVLERKYPDSHKDPLSNCSFQRRKEKWQRMHLSVKDHLAVFSNT